MVLRCVHHHFWVGTIHPRPRVIVRYVSQHHVAIPGPLRAVNNFPAYCYHRSFIDTSYGCQLYREFDLVMFISSGGPVSIGHTREMVSPLSNHLTSTRYMIPASLCFISRVVRNNFCCVSPRTENPFQCLCCMDAFVLRFHPHCHIV